MTGSRSARRRGRRNRRRSSSSVARMINTGFGAERLRCSIRRAHANTVFSRTSRTILICRKTNFGESLLVGARSTALLGGRRLDVARIFLSSSGFFASGHRRYFRISAVTGTSRASQTDLSVNLARSRINGVGRGTRCHALLATGNRRRDVATVFRFGWFALDQSNPSITADTSASGTSYTGFSVNLARSNENFFEGARKRTLLATGRRRLDVARISFLSGLWARSRLYGGIQDSTNTSGSRTSHAGFSSILTWGNEGLDPRTRLGARITRGFRRDVAGRRGVSGGIRALDSRRCANSVALPFGTGATDANFAVKTTATAGGARTRNFALATASLEARRSRVRVCNTVRSGKATSTVTTGASTAKRGIVESFASRGSSKATNLTLNWNLFANVSSASNGRDRITRSEASTLTTGASRARVILRTFPCDISTTGTRGKARRTDEARRSGISRSGTLGRRVTAGTIGTRASATESTVRAIASTVASGSTLLYGRVGPSTTLYASSSGVTPNNVTSTAIVSSTSDSLGVVTSCTSARIFRALNFSFFLRANAAIAAALPTWVALRRYRSNS